LWPYDQQGWAWEDDMPWCGTLRVTRWLRSDAQGKGTPPPPTRLRLQRLALIAPTDTDLPGAQEECRRLRHLATTNDIQDISPAVATWQAVITILEGLSLPKTFEPVSNQNAFN